MGKVITDEERENAWQRICGLIISIVICLRAVQSQRKNTSE